MSRIPRVAGGGTQRSGQAAFGNMCRSGRMFAPGKLWRKWHKKINVNQRRFAVASAIAASALAPLVMARGHVIDQVPELPLVIGGDVEATKKTSAMVKILEALGCGGDLAKVVASKKIRAGVGKTRNRRYTMRRGPLIVYAAQDGIERAARNLPGVELVQVERLNLLQLAPGGHVGRLVVWTEAAFNKLDAVYAAKTGYTLPAAPMANSDLARIINSDEVQTALKPAQLHGSVKKQKVNPLKNAAVMASLNPYVATMRKVEAAAQAASKASKAKRLAAARANTGKKAASKAFFEAASAGGEMASL